MSSSNVVFAMCYCIPYHTKNKSLVLEWPTIIEVLGFLYSYIGDPDVIHPLHLHKSQMFCAPQHPQYSAFIILLKPPRSGTRKIFFENRMLNVEETGSGIFPGTYQNNQSVKNSLLRSINQTFFFLYFMFAQ
jgi:hypothetical protein